MHYDIDAEFHGSLQERRHKRVITDNTRAAAMCDLRYSLQVGHDHDRIGRRLDKNHFSIWLERGFYVQRFRSIYKIKLEVVICEDLCEETRRPAVSVIGNDHVLTRFDKPQRGIDGGHTGSKGKAEARAFESGDVGFDCRTSRVLCARVLETFVFSKSILRVRRGLIDWNRNRPRRRVGFLSRMN